MLIGLSAAQITSADSTIASMQPPPKQKVHPVSAMRFDWFDAGRSRHVPATVYYPSDVERPMPVIRELRILKSV